jgi:hypothetical protein
MTAASDQHARRWWILVLVGIAQLMVVLDVTIRFKSIAPLHDRAPFRGGGRRR